jgi:Cdc6-like AAA superfamily ATPase
MVAGCFQWITNLHEKILVKLLEKEVQKVVVELMDEMDVMVKTEKMELVLYLKLLMINDMYHIMMVLLGKY